MTYYFKHPNYTKGEKISIGNDEFEALGTLQNDYSLGLEDVLQLCLDNYVRELP